jgi:hypothetical protein
LGSPDGSWGSDRRRVERLPAGIHYTFPQGLDQRKATKSLSGRVFEEPLNVVVGEVAPASGRKITGQIEGPDAVSVEPGHPGLAGGDHAAYLVVAALPEDDRRLPLDGRIPAGFRSISSTAGKVGSVVAFEQDPLAKRASASGARRPSTVAR